MTKPLTALTVPKTLKVLQEGTHTPLEEAQRSTMDLRYCKLPDQQDVYPCFGERVEEDSQNELHAIPVNIQRYRGRIDRSRPRHTALKLSHALQHTNVAHSSTIFPPILTISFPIPRLSFGTPLLVCVASTVNLTRC